MTTALKRWLSRR